MSRRGASPSRRQRPQGALKERLAVARAQVRAYGKALKAMPPAEYGGVVVGGQPRVIQVFEVRHGAYHTSLGVLYDDGSLWERHTLMDPADKKQVKDEWWQEIVVEPKRKPSSVGRAE